MLALLLLALTAIFLYRAIATLKQLTQLFDKHETSDQPDTYWTEMEVEEAAEIIPENWLD